MFVEKVAETRKGSGDFEIIQSDLIRTKPQTLLNTVKLISSLLLAE